MLNKIRFKNNKGFSLIELIVVMAVMAILVLLAAPKYLNYVKDAEVIAMEADIRLIEDIVERDQIEDPDGGWPVTDNEPDLSDEAKDAIVDDYVDAVGGEDYPKTEDGEPDKDAIIDLSGVKPVDSSKIKDKTKNTKDDPSDYVIITKGPLKGEIYHKDGYEDSNGKYHNGLDSLATRRKDKTVKESRYVMATDSDFEFIEDVYAPDGVGYFRYIGDGDYVEIPHTIQNKSIESYYKMFASGASNTVKGVKSTNKNIKYLNNMFSGSELAKMDLIYFNASGVENASQMFSGAKIDGEVNMSNFNAPNIANMSAMFVSVQAGSINFSNVKVTHGLNLLLSDYEGPIEDAPEPETVSTVSMFYRAIIDGEINMSNFNAPNVVDMRTMFGSVQAKSINFSNAQVTHGFSLLSPVYEGYVETKITPNTQSMFLNSIIQEDINMGNFKAPNIMDMSRVFQGVQADSIDFSNAEITDGLDSGAFIFKSDEPIGPDMTYMFDGSDIKNDINLSNLNAPNVIHMNYMFSQAKANFVDMSKSSFTTGLTAFIEGLQPERDEGHDDWMRMRSIFANAVISDINMSDIEAPYLIDLEWAFNKAQVENLNISNFNAPNLKSVKGMFQYYQSTELDLSNFDVSKLDNLDYMFNLSPLSKVTMQNTHQASKLMGSAALPDTLTVYYKSQ